MPTVRYFDCSACFCAHGWSCASIGDLYSSSNPCSAACKCGSPVPPNQTSSLGLAFSAAICANDSPEPFNVNPTLMPVSFSNSVAASEHHSDCTGQITFSCCPKANVAQLDAIAARIAMLRTQRCADRRDVMRLSSLLGPDFSAGL